MATTRSEGQIEILEKSVSVLQEDLGSVHVRLDNITSLLEQLLIDKQKDPGNTNGSAAPPSHEQQDSSKYEKDDDTDVLRQAARRIDLPPFDGSEPLAWLGKIEQYFQLHGTVPSHRLPISVWMDQPFTGSVG